LVGSAPTRATTLPAGGRRPLPSSARTPTLDAAGRIEQFGEADVPSLYAGLVGVDGGRRAVVYLTELSRASSRGSGP